ncbi:MAG: hypothetical protein J0I49_22440 [Pseudonocardia sp.]|uniref:hypothetical protein n=1 Tax=Pseudonocardia sp. TaxID=60912 RepID=UPI001AD476CF|nr:hypothetical protein [Pseudonocardia sp.]MBN9100846.1 hypothetical protein [Pseudonocardia sp.]
MPLTVSLGRLATLALAAATGVVLLGSPPARAADPAPATSGVDAATLPALARESLPLIVDLTSTGCPELPPVWVVAQVQAESGWDAGLHSDEPGGPAGLYQFGQRNWIAAGGRAWASDPPGADADVLTAAAHLKIAVPWVCANLRAVTAHLKATGKTTAPLDAMLVCHIAGCGRVTGSRTGIPTAGEAGCAARCAQVIGRYIDAVHGNLKRFAAPPVAPPPPAAPAPAQPAAPAAWNGGATGCRPGQDPTRKGGCLTGATRHGLDAVSATFGGWKNGPLIHNTGCWDAHAWNPTSDHSKGKACDFMITTPGTFAKGAELDHGWTIAKWLRANAGPLQVKYLIWQGRYWDPSVKDQGGSWGQAYTGGGVYNVRDATGGHYDHVHASFRE